MREKHARADSVVRGNDFRCWRKTLEIHSVTGNLDRHRAAASTQRAGKVLRGRLRVGRWRSEVIEPLDRIWMPDTAVERQVTEHRHGPRIGPSCSL